MSPLEIATSPAFFQGLSACVRWSIVLYIGVKCGKVLGSYL